MSPLLGLSTGDWPVRPGGRQGNPIAVHSPGLLSVRTTSVFRLLDRFLAGQSTPPAGVDLKIEENGLRAGNGLGQRYPSEETLCPLLSR